MKIKDVSEKFNISEDTLRYYEKIGLIPKVPRNKNGIRDYTEWSCRHIDFVICMRNAGVSVKSLVEYFNLLGNGKSTVSKRKKLLIKEQEKLINKRSELDNYINKLTNKINQYNEIENGTREDFKL